MDKKKKKLIRIIISTLLFTSAIIFKPSEKTLLFILYLASYIIVGYDVILKALRNIANGQVFDENFLMGIASIGAFFLGEYPEGVAVMLFYQIGELFQSHAVDRSRKSIASLMDIRPDFANVKRGEDILTVDPDEVQIGETIVIKPGEKVPLDAVVLEGFSMVDTSVLTGESIPKEIAAGDELLSGCINTSGMLVAKVTKEFGESTVSKILDLVENASSKKSNSENFITKFARYYTPIVVIMAVFLAIIPPVIMPNATFSDWLGRALTFLVISCPCALVISVPLSFFGGLGAASRNGVLIKGSNYLEALAKTEIVVFDKTGTLTKGVFKVQEIFPQNISKQGLLEMAALTENYSNHPISKSLKEAYGKQIDTSRISDTEEIAGHGVIATVDGLEVAVGNKKLLVALNLPQKDTKDAVGTIVHVIIDKQYKGYIVIADEVKEDAKKTIADLKAAKIKQTVMLTGDSKVIAQRVANELGLDKVYSELLPTDKVEKVEQLFKEKSDKGKLVFVGDGINDAPVLARADIGIAMGALGSDAAIEAADIVIMTDEPSKITTAMKVSKKTLSIAKQNIIFALGVKFLVLILGALGLASMWAAVFADVGVSVIAILNAIRILNVKQI